MDCPLDIYLAGESYGKMDLTVFGLCQNDEGSAERIEFQIETQKKLDFRQSKFSVIDQNYSAKNLSDYFEFDSQENSFFIESSEAERMWSSLKTGEYQFSFNAISEDFDFAKTYSFSFEIK